MSENGCVLSLRGVKRRSNLVVSNCTNNEIAASPFDKFTLSLSKGSGLLAMTTCEQRKCIEQDQANRVRVTRALYFSAWAWDGMTAERVRAQADPQATPKRSASPGDAPRA